MSKAFEHPVFIKARRVLLSAKAGQLGAAEKYVYLAVERVAQELAPRGWRTKERLREAMLRRLYSEVSMFGRVMYE